MNPTTVKRLFRPFIRSAARRSLVGRNRLRTESAQGRFTKREVNGLLHQTWQRYHALAPDALVEVVDEQHRPVPPGEYGARLLVTTLFSRTQPLIRYALNDSVRLGPSAAQACPCGRPFGVLEGVQGRVEDLLRLPGLRGEPVTIQPLVFNRVMDILPISGWQVAQEADGGLIVLVGGARAEFDGTALVQGLGRALAEQGAQPPIIRVQQAAAIPKSASGKAPLIKAWRDAPVVLQREIGSHNHETEAVQ